VRAAARKIDLRCLARRRRQAELERGDRPRRDERERGHEHGPSRLRDAALAHLPLLDGRDDPAEALGEPHDEPAGHLGDLGPRRGGGVEGAIGAQRRRHRHHRQNLSRCPQFHDPASRMLTPTEGNVKRALTIIGRLVSRCFATDSGENGGYGRMCGRE
jgi:hypothetical protein